jgi:hypothetical protein
MLTDSSLRLTISHALDLMVIHPEIRESRWLTALVFAAVERSGYDRGHAVATAEANATEPTEERDL